MNDQNNRNDNSRTGEPMQYCMMCMRSEKDAGKLIRMPGNLCLCQDCMQRSMDMFNNPDFLSQLRLPGGLDPQAFFGGLLNPNSPLPGLDPSKTQNVQHSGASDIRTEDVAQAPQEGGTGSETTSSGPTSSETVPPDETGGSAESEEKGPERRTISIFNLGSLFGQNPQPRRKTVKKKEGPGILDLKSVPAPHKIKAMLDQYVIGQDHAKKVLSVAVYNHYKRIFTNTMDEIEIEKSNVLMLGPTGCGKTYLVRTLARVLDVPLAISDATSLTEAGYIGDDIESVVSKLLMEADEDVERCEKGIVFIDEIDKIAKKKNANQRDVSGESVQQGLLSLLEGSSIDVPVGANSKNAMVPMTTVNTRNILFICAGAFPGLEDIIKERLNKTASIGFQSDLKDRYDQDPDILTAVTPEDLRKYGMIPEFIGRLPVICPLRSMTKEMLTSIMTDPRNAILRQYQKLLELDEVRLEFDPSALEAIADQALERETGARGLRAVIEDFMLDIMYEIPKDENIGRVVITGDYIRHKGLPQIYMRGSDVKLLE